jgi:autophagy-related protein 2
MTLKFSFLIKRCMSSVRVDSLDRAYEAVSREVTSTLDTIVVLPFKEYRRTGHAGGALKCVVRAIPVAVLRPTAGAAEALSYTLLGLRNNLDPDQRRDEEGKWAIDIDLL